MTNEELKNALQTAFNEGSKTADGYIRGLGSMGSQRTLGEGDNHANKIRKEWPALRNEIVQDLLPDCPSGEKHQWGRWEWIQNSVHEAYIRNCVSTDCAYFQKIDELTSVGRPLTDKS